jgi:streptogramin lyase
MRPTDAISCLLLVTLSFLMTRRVTAQVVTAAWAVTNVAGTGVAGRSGDGGPAQRAELNQPYGISRGPDGALYICDCENQLIRKVGRDGTISTFAGSGRVGYGGDGGPALLAGLNEPYEIRFDRAGNVFFVEMRNNVVRRVDGKTGIISTVAGTGKPGFSGDGGPATGAMLNQPHSIQFDSHGNLYICDIANNRIRKVDMTTGTITTFAGTGGRGATPDGAKIEGTPLNGPRAIDFDRAGNLWLALRDGNAVYRLDLSTGTIHHVAGTGKKGFTGNGGPALGATLSGPKGLSIGPDGNVYVADTESHGIRMIDVGKGTIELIAGTGEKGDGPPGDASKCRFTRPHGIFVDADGSIFVGDTESNRVRVIRPGK